MPVRTEYNMLHSGPAAYVIPPNETAFMKSSLTEYMKLMKPYALHTESWDEVNHNQSKVVERLENELNELSLSDSGNRMKIPKRVKFADTVGLDLVHIRHMTAGRDTPPDLSNYMFSDLNLATETKCDVPVLILGFQQPVSDYTRFRDLVEDNSISLECVSINPESIVGTIKVKNLAFHKTVFARFTTDDWATSQDITAYYVNNGLANGQGDQMPSQIDTFSFTCDVNDLQLHHNAIQFAVCFRCNGQEFWDNNDSKNYTINVKGTSKVGLARYGKGKKSLDCYSDRQQTNWTEFAIWRNIGSEFTPYW